MNCNCKWTETIFGLVVLLVVFWPNMFSAMVNKWILVVVAVLFILHAFGCKSCRMGGHEEMSKKKKR